MKWQINLFLLLQLDKSHENYDMHVQNDDDDETQTLHSFYISNPHLSQSPFRLYNH